MPEHLICRLCGDCESPDADRTVAAAQTIAYVDAHRVGEPLILHVRREAG